MLRELYAKEDKRKIEIKNDDLIFDGKHVLIPSYWVSSMLDFLNNDENSIAEADRQDYKQLKSFLFEVEEFIHQ